MLNFESSNPCTYHYTSAHAVILSYHLPNLLFTIYVFKAVQLLLGSPSK